MNAERLNRILTDLNQMFKKENTLAILQEVRDNLQNQVSQPNQPAFQTSLVKSLENLYINLNSSTFNDFSPSWKQVIEEISGKTVLGVFLRQKIESILSSNLITPAKALEDIVKIYDDLVKFQSAVSNTLSGFKTLGISKEELEKGECELGYSIPREFVDNNLSQLKKEIKELIFILDHISEAVTGEKQDFKVKTISSSDFLFYILISLGIANVLSKATERILNHYKQILEIKLLRNQLKNKGVPDENTKEIEKYVNGMMEEEIKKIASEVVQNSNQEVGRKNELENGLIIALNKLANRIDKGFNIEIRVEPLPEPKNGEQRSDEEQNKVNLISSIKESAKNIEYMKSSGSSILELPEKLDK